jgi:hypothetical protein
MKKKRDKKAAVRDKARQKSAREAKIHTLLDELRAELAKVPEGVKITGT